MTDERPAWIVQHEIEQFYYEEAALLDARRFDEWLQLFTDDVRYFMPVRSLRYKSDSDREWSGPSQVAHFDDDKSHLAMRVGRLMTGFAWADEPATRTRHLVSNVRIRPGSEPGTFSVSSAFIVYHGHGERDVRLYAGGREDVLRNVEGGTRIARRAIALDATILPANLGVFF